MKKITSLLIALSLIFGLWNGIDLSTRAELYNNSEEEYIYYTDLFYAYPYYLANDPYFNNYTETLENMYDSVHIAYQESELKIATGIGSALENITSPTDMTKLITDVLGLTDFSYNDALDAANEEVVRNLVSDSLVYSLEKDFGKVANWNKKINGVVAKFNELELTSDSGQVVHNAEYYAKEAFDALHDGGYFKFISDEVIANLWIEINAESFALNDCFELASTEIEIAEAIVTSIMLEDIRLEVVNDIIATQSSETVLKQGMRRLKNKLQGNFVTNFIENYLVKKVADKVFDTVDDWVVDAVMSPKLATLLNFAKVVFNNTVEYPSVQMVLKWQTLICYSKDLSNGISGLASRCAEGIFLSDRIITYENMFIAYDAINKATIETSMDIKDMVDPFSEVFAIRNEAIVNGITTLKIRYADQEVTIPVGASEEDFLDVLYADTFESSDGTVYDIPDKFEISNGTSMATICVKANCFASALQNSVIVARKDVEAFESAYADVSLYGKHIKNVKKTICNTPADERQSISAETYDGWTYTLTSDIKLRRESDIVEKGCYYAVNGYMLGNANVEGYTVPAGLEIGIAGNVELGAWESLTVSNDAKFNVKGNLIVNAWAYADAYRSTITSNGCLEVFGTVRGYGNFYGSGRYIFHNVSGSSLNFKTATYELKGDAQSNISYENARVVVSGSNQSIALKGTIKSLDVLATAVTVIPDATITEYIDFHGNNVTVSDYIDLASTAIAVEGSNYKKLNFPNRYTLTNNIMATEMYFKGGLNVNSGSYTLFGNVDFWYGNDFVVIKEGAALTVTGYITGTEWAWQPIRTGITNNGELTVNGTTFYRFNLGGSGVYNLNDIYSTNTFIKFTKGTFNVQGNVTSGKVTVENVKCINVCGNTTQTLNFNGNISRLVLNNTVGTTFSSAIKVTTLFNHKGNSFTLNAGGTFVDYDGDGMKDNVDPEPTVGNPCAVTFKSNDESYGTVSESEINTYGGTELTVTAAPTAKYKFVKWINASGSTVSTSASYTFVAKANTELTAVFEKRSQPIATECTGGTIIAPSSAAIESEVQVSVTEEEGYVYTKGTLKYNGITVENNSFIMPDESVILTAEFVRNESYFLLKEKIEEAQRYTYEEYSADSFSILTQKITGAETVLKNDITEEKANDYINELDNAIGCLVSRYIEKMEVKNIPEIYVGLENIQEKLVLTVTYDNGIIVDTNEYVVEKYQKDVLGKQEVVLEYEQSSIEISVQVVKRKLEQCTIAEIPMQLFLGKEERCEPVPDIIYSDTKEELVLDEDYTIVYSDNNKIGLATLVITGIGRYEGTLESTFEIYCEHNYERYEYQAPTCLEDGYTKDRCLICDDVAISATHEALGHNYEINYKVAEYPSTTNNTVFDYRCTECQSQVSIESLKTTIGQESVAVTENIVADLGMVQSIEKGFAFQIENFTDAGVNASLQIGAYNTMAQNPLQDGYTFCLSSTSSSLVLKIVLKKANNEEILRTVTMSGIKEDFFTFSIWRADSRLYLAVNGNQIISYEEDDSIEKGTHFSVFSEINGAIEVRNIKEHIWNAGVLQKYPTITEKGEWLYSCVNCDETKVEEIPEVVTVTPVELLGYGEIESEAVVIGIDTNQNLTEDEEKCENVDVLIRNVATGQEIMLTSDLTVTQETMLGIVFEVDSDFNWVKEDVVIVIPKETVFCCAKRAFGITYDVVYRYSEEDAMWVAACVEHEASDTISLDVVPTTSTNGSYSVYCKNCGELMETIELPYLRFSGASLTLQNNLAIKYRVRKSVVDGFYENPYAIFEMGGKKTRVTRYTEDGEYYLFEFKNIAPHQMNDTIYATLYGEFNGKEYASATIEYSVATYCYNMLPKLTSDSYAKLRTLLVDLLNYGAEAQIYTDYNTDNLVNASLTEEQATWATQGDPELETVLNTKYATVESPSVKWKNAILNLNDSITIQVMMATDDISGLKVKFTDKDGKVLATVSESQFVETDGGYYVNFKGLHAGQMSEAIYITAYRDDVAVSNTVQYSIESYAHSKQDSNYLNLGDLVKAMMKYGDAAYAYSN